MCFPSPHPSSGPQPLPCARVPQPCSSVSGSGAWSGCAVPPEPSVLQVSVSEQRQRWSLLGWVTPCGCILPAQSSDGQAVYCQTVGWRRSTVVFSHCPSFPGLQTPLCSESQAPGEQGGWSPAFPDRPVPTRASVLNSPGRGGGKSMATATGGTSEGTAPPGPRTPGEEPAPCRTRAWGSPLPTPREAQPVWTTTVSHAPGGQNHPLGLRLGTLGPSPPWSGVWAETGTLGPSPHPPPGHCLLGAAPSAQFSQCLSRRGCS